MLTDDRSLLQAIQQANDLTDLSKRQYSTHLLKLQRLTGNRSLLETVRDVQTTMRAIDAALTSGQIHTRHAVTAAVVALFKRVPCLKNDFPDALAAWRQHTHESGKVVSARMDTNVPTERQAEGFVELTEILQKRDSLPKGSWERLLLVMYTEIPPGRRDLWRTPVLSHRDTAPPPQEAPNYIQLSSNARTATLFLRQFKSHRYLGDQQLSLNRRIVSELKASLQRFPRRYLFVSLKDNATPYNSQNAYGHWCNNTLRFLFGRKHINLTMLRHIYCSAIDMNTSRAERMEIARKMQHTETTQQQYRLLFSDRQSSSADPVLNINSAKS
jgi:hypothetical protein